MSVKKILQQQALFKDITADSLDLLAKEAKILDFEPEEEIITYGHAGRYFAIVLKGQLAVFDSEENRVAFIKEGEFLGEMSLLTGEPSIADVRSAAATRLMMIPHGVMSQVISKNPVMIKRLASTMRVRLLQREGSPGEEDAPRAEDLLAGLGGSAKKILVINCGSSSLKWSLYDTASADRIACGLVERIGFENARHSIKVKNKNSGKEKAIKKHLPDADHAAAMQDVLEFLTGEKGPLDSVEEIDAIGHRVVHGGEKYTSPVVIDDDVIAKVKSLFVLAPLHNPVNLVGVETARKILPNVPQVAVFDTAFHQTMPPHAYLYGLPYKFYKKNGIRRYGFHGTSHHYVAMQAAAYLKRPLSELMIISCHLGNGASMCAIDHGRSIDTSMGLTPLEGLIMGSRSGDVDAGILFYLTREYNLGVEELHGLLNKKSGLAGLSGVSNDMREISEAASKGDQQALKAIQVFCYRIKKYIGAYVAALDGLDVLIFTGGIGLGAPGVRARVCQGLARLGIVLDVMKNHFFAKPDSTKEISDPASAVKVLVIPTDEEKMIARETMRALQQNEVAKIIEMPANRQRQVPIYVYERHVHLSANDRDVLFGQGYTLTEVEGQSAKRRGLYKERIHLIGPKGKIEDVKICAPLKPDSTVEIGRTEEFLLGIDAPIRGPGDIAGTPGVTLAGPKGKVALKQGVINAPLRILLQPEDALAFGLHDGDRVVFAVDAAHSHVFGDVLIRVRPNFTLGMHLNMDDAKAVEVTEGMTGRIVGIVETQTR